MIYYQTQLIWSGILLAAALIAYLILRVIRKKHLNDPQWVARQEEYEREMKRQAEEERILISSMNDPDSD